jgi:hypothetical protein
LRLESVSHVYRQGGVRALAEVSLTFGPGEVVALVGVGVEYVQVPWKALREQNEDLYRMYDFFEREGYQADITALRAQYPQLKTFEGWLEEGGLAELSAAA